MNDSTIKAGTPCFLIRLGERADLNGRVVTIVSGPASSADEEGCDHYIATAAWVKDLYQGSDTILRRMFLLPITPPPLKLPAPKIAAPIDA